MFKIVQYNLKTNVNKICYLQGHLHACTLQKKKKQKLTTIIYKVNWISNLKESKSKLFT